MKHSLCAAIIFMILLSSESNAEDFNVIGIGSYEVKLDHDDVSIIHIEGKSHDEIRSCKISNRQSSYNTGMGVLELTNDKLGLLVNSTNQYLLPQEVLDCKNGEVKLHDIPGAESQGDTIIDVNFKYGLYLSLSLEDARSLSYTAIISRFGSSKNVLSGAGFFDCGTSPVPFYTNGDRYIGKISLNGQYVHPYELDCAFDSFPGVWDIKAKKKVIFPRRLGDDEIHNRCQKLFDGEATLEALGGELINPKQDRFFRNNSK